MENGIQKRILDNKRVKDENVICRFPRNMLLEPTNICNHECLMCANSKGTKKKGLIDEKFAKKILKQAYDLGTREVGFYGMGEPLINERLEDYIQYAKELGYEYVYITTNGVLLSEKRARSLLSSGVDSIKFSINAATPEKYYFIHGKDDFDKVINNLICLDSLRKKQQRKVALYISYIATRYTVSDEENFELKYRQYVDDIVFMDCRSAGDMLDEIKNYLAVSKEADNIFSMENNICPMVFNKLHITYEGYLTMCCDDLQNYLAVADLNEENLETAWNNQYACDLRKRHLEHNLKGTRCFNCIYHCTEPIEPINLKLAITYKDHEWNKVTEIEDRIHNRYSPV